MVWPLARVWVRRGMAGFRIGVKRIWFQVALGYLKIFMLVQTHQPTAGRLMPDIFA